MLYHIDDPQEMLYYNPIWDYNTLGKVAGTKSVGE